MTTNPEPRVIRWYTLPVARFDHLKNYQRNLQLQVDRAAREHGPTEPAQVLTNSEALATILHQHELLGTAAAFAGMRIDQFVTALYFGDLKTVPVQGGR